MVIDDPDSILKCTNKVYLAELLARHNVPAPKTMLVHRDNIDEIESRSACRWCSSSPTARSRLAWSRCWRPPSSSPRCENVLKASELVVAQEYLPTTFDWRVGVLDGRPLYVCRYHMASGHWQIIKHDGDRAWTKAMSTRWRLAKRPTP